MGRFLTRRKMLVAGAGAAAATPALLAGRASVAAQTSNRTGPTHVELAPQRIYDSRRPDSLMGGARLESGESLLIHAGIPEGFDFTLGVFVNCTITDTIGAGWLTLFALLAESPAPGTSTSHRPRTSTGRRPVRHWPTSPSARSAPNIRSRYSATAEARRTSSSTARATSSSHRPELPTTPSSSSPSTSDSCSRSCRTTPDDA